jgi:hypothetical protein
MEAHDISHAISSSGQMLRDTHRLGEQLGISEVDAILAQCTTWRALAALHDAWARRLHSLDIAKQVAAKGNELPEPPFPGTKDIQPVTTVYDLLMEGTGMHHCVGSYLDAIRRGDSYIYKVFSPNRATVELGHDKNRQWILRQIKGYCNRDPGMPTVTNVQAWLKNAAYPVQFRIENS